LEDGTQYFWRTEFLVNCDKNGAVEDFLKVENLKVYQDLEDKCLLRVEATHASGCPTYERRGFD
jgi:hypothetical protein